MNRATAPHDRGRDPSVVWGIALDVRLDQAADAPAVQERLDLLVARQPGLGLRPRVSASVDVAELASRPFEDDLVRVGVADDRVVVAGHHAVVDGLGLLALLSALTGLEIRSSARGVAGRESRAFLRAAAGRVAEALVRPSAVVAGSGRSRAGLDVVARRSLAGHVGTTDLVVAATSTVSRWNREHGRRAERISIAVGASSRSGNEADSVVDESCYLRLTDVERLGRDEVAERIRHQPPEGASEGGPGNPVVARAMGAFSRRTGSTALVSHLGRVGGDGLAELVFFPVTGGTSGVSLGASTVHGRTTLALRSRAGRHTAPELDLLLDKIAGHLDGPASSGPRG